jgi:hypothetical protein
MKIIWSVDGTTKGTKAERAPRKGREGRENGGKKQRANEMRLNEGQKADSDREEKGR